MHDLPQIVNFCPKVPQQSKTSPSVLAVLVGLNDSAYVFFVFKGKVDTKTQFFNSFIK